MKQDKKMSLDDVKATINKKFGAGSIMHGRTSIVNLESYSTGVISIDVAMGCGGVPRGRIIELYGAEGSGKTTTALQFAAACQSKRFCADKNCADSDSVLSNVLYSQYVDEDRDGVCAFVDVEHALDLNWAENMGVKVDDILLSQPDSGEEALQIVEIMARSRAVDLIIIDSVAALIPQSELAGEIGDSAIGAQARLMSQALRKLSGIASKTGTTLLFINQTRSKIGVVFGNPETTPGGKALKYYASVRMSISSGGKIKDGDAIIGSRPRIKVIKNKLGYPYGTAEYDICVGHPNRPVYGIDTVCALFDYAVSDEIITQRGSHYSYNDTTLGNGKSNALRFLRENAEITDKIRHQIYNKVFAGMRI